MRLATQSTTRQEAGTVTRGGIPEAEVPKGEGHWRSVAVRKMLELVTAAAVGGGG